MKEDYILGIGDGIAGTKEGFKNDMVAYEDGYGMGRRIAAGSKGLSIKEANLIKMLGGFFLTENEIHKLKKLSLDVYNQMGDFEEVFSVAPEWHEYI